MPSDHLQLVRGLRAAADPSRLRLLGLLALGEFAVSELTDILGQSQPRVSRHLRVLTEAGLLERFRELHWVFYRLAAAGEGAALARALLVHLDLRDPVVSLDRERAAQVLARRAAGAGGAAMGDGTAVAERGELAAVVVGEFGDCGFDALLYVGHAPTEMLQVLGPTARRVVGVSDSRIEVQRARATLHGRGLAHCVLQQGDLHAMTAGSADFDAIVLDRLLGNGARPGESLAEAARVLRPGGRLVVIEDYEALAVRTGGGNPLVALRSWLAGSGLRCARIRPVDMGTSHLLVAVAASEQGQAAA